MPGAPLPPSTQLLSVACTCGWHDSLPGSAGGLTIECPRCGRNLRLPQTRAATSESDEDVAIVERLTGRRFLPPSLKPVQKLAAVAAAISIAAGAVLLLLAFSPALAIAIGSLGPVWWMSLWLAQRALAAFLSGSQSA